MLDEEENRKKLVINIGIAVIACLIVIGLYFMVRPNDPSRSTGGTAALKLGVSNAQLEYMNNFMQLYMNASSEFTSKEIANGDELSDKEKLTISYFFIQWFSNDIIEDWSQIDNKCNQFNLSKEDLERVMKSLFGTNTTYQHKSVMLDISWLRKGNSLKFIYDPVLEKYAVSGPFYCVKTEDNIPASTYLTYDNDIKKEGTTVTITANYVYRKIDAQNGNGGNYAYYKNKNNTMTSLFTMPATYDDAGVHDLNALLEDKEKEKFKSYKDEFSKVKFVFELKDNYGIQLISINPVAK